MVIVRWVGSCAAVRVAEWARAHREVDRRRRRQPLGGGHERLRLVGVIGALGLAQQRGDPGQHPVVGHGLNLGHRADDPGLDGVPARGAVPRTGLLHNPRSPGDEGVQRGGELR